MSDFISEKFWMIGRSLIRISRRTGGRGAGGAREGSGRNANDGALLTCLPLLQVGRVLVSVPSWWNQPGDSECVWNKNSQRDERLHPHAASGRDVLRPCVLPQVSLGAWCHVIGPCGTCDL